MNASETLYTKLKNRDIDLIISLDFFRTLIDEHMYVKYLFNLNLKEGSFYAGNVYGSSIYVDTSLPYNEIIEI